MFSCLFFKKSKQPDGTLKIWELTCIRPFFSPWKSHATQQLESVIKQHNDINNLNHLKIIKKCIDLWLNERQNISNRIKLIHNFRSKIIQKIERLKMQHKQLHQLRDEVEFIPEITKKFDTCTYYYTTKLEMEKHITSLLTECNTSFASIYNLFVTIPNAAAISHASEHYRFLFFENCYVIHMNIETFLDRYQLTPENKQQLEVKKDQLSRLMKSIDDINREKMQKNLGGGLYQFRCDSKYRDKLYNTVHRKFHTLVLLPFMNFFLEVDSLFDLTLEFVNASIL